ncbi:MAG: ferric iron uptake transcriptional regulator [Candidatus Competibacterales bacterium]
MASKELKQAGLKVTLPRVKILEILHNKEADHHLTAEAIYRALLQAGDDVGLATVYRVLTQFESAGLVKRHHFEGNQSVFELNRTGHHDHIICVECGRIFEFRDEFVDRRQREIARQQGFELADTSLVLYGNCTRQDCPHRLEATADQDP